MTTPNVPLRLEFELEVPGPPEHVWAALATAHGISAWFLPTDSEERLGGRLVTHMGPGDDMPADITGWEPPHRFAYEEDISALVRAEGDAITPLATEFLVEARSGGTCVVRVVSSAFGTGADWEREFFDQMATGWVPFFEQLRLYVQHFAGQRATTFDVSRVIPGTSEEVQAAVRGRLDAHASGDQVVLGEVRGIVERPAPVLLVRLDAPVPGMLRIATGGPPSDERTEVRGYLFPADGTDTPGLVEEQRGVWERFLAGLTVEAAR
jgi:uncharacterized protein YndB with AHSA1/START domain